MNIVYIYIYIIIIIVIININYDNNDNHNNNNNNDNIDFSLRVPRRAGQPSRGFGILGRGFRIYIYI